jgi:MFS family permease
MFGVERFGRKKPLLVGVFLMSLFLWIIGAIFYTHNPQVFDAAKNKWVTPATAETSSASIAMAVMIYLYVIPYCFSVGPIPWVICSEIFNNRTRHYGLMTAAASQWVWNFGVSKSTPLLVDAMPRGGLFFFFGAINIISLVLTYFFVPETQGVSLEAMDILFGSITAEEREADVQRRAKDLHVEETEKDIADISHNEKRRSADRMA